MKTRLIIFALILGVISGGFVSAATTVSEDEFKKAYLLIQEADQNKLVKEDELLLHRSGDGVELVEEIVGTIHNRLPGI